MTRTPAEAIPDGIALAEDTDSINTYKRRYMQLGKQPGIDTEIEAQRLADLVLASVRKPLWRWKGKDHVLIHDHPNMRNAVGVYWSHAW